MCHFGYTYLSHSPNPKLPKTISCKYCYPPIAAQLHAGEHCRGVSAAWCPHASPARAAGVASLSRRPLPVELVLLLVTDGQ